MSHGFYGPTRPKHDAHTLWTNLGGNPEWLDPALAADSQSGMVISNIFAGLTQLHPQTLEPMPDVARGWTVDESGKRYVFQLRETQWSDGKPVTAYDFEFSLRRVLDPQTGSRYGVLLYPILYAEQVHNSALRVEGFSEPLSSTADALPEVTAALRAWAAPVLEVERVVVGADGRTVFLHPAAALTAEERTAHCQTLQARPFAGQGVQVRVTQPRDLGVRALANDLLEIRLHKPAPYWLSVLAFYTAAPVPRHLFAQLEARGVPQIHWTRPEYMVVNGAYRLKEWVFRSHMLLEKNPRYWDAEQVQLERIRLLMIESYNTALNLYRASELDHIGNTALPSELMDSLQSFRDFRRDKQLSIYFLWLNTARPPLDDVRVREALSLAIDRQQLVQYVVRGGQQPSADLVPDGLIGYEGLHRPLFDPQRARDLLKQAGYGPGKSLPPVYYKYNTSEGHKQIAEAIQQMWKQHLGIDARIENEEWRVFLKSLDLKDFQIARLGWVADYPDPTTFLELLLGGNENNHSNWQNPEFDRLMREAGATVDAEARLALMRKAEAVALAAQPLIPIYVSTRSEMVKPYVRNAFLNAQNQTLFKYMSIDPRYYEGTPAPLPDVPPPLLEPLPLRAVPEVQGEGSP